MSCKTPAEKPQAGGLNNHAKTPGLKAWLQSLATMHHFGNASAALLDLQLYTHGEPQCDGSLQQLTVCVNVCVEVRVCVDKQSEQEQHDVRM